MRAATRRWPLPLVGQAASKAIFQGDGKVIYRLRDWTAERTD
jgi:hypothetical protein